ncbi:HEAT repeat domain-containing protein [Corallococcus sp. M34]|uniref:HEAT repeat domain-containing protein n=1 Tax=Citreicoccus inhibens TaxID=2849499 RepID=UPI001C223442|nr:HEAT repeat domain-containing protein [Citreicoccus inhibens]MBU8894375.1 HEAT repeat domain-containing protein [Citreicoccus inhibens]
MSRSFVALCLSVSFLALVGCKKDPATPDYWEEYLARIRRADDRVRLIESMRSSGKANASFLPMLHAQLAAEHKPEVKGALARALADVHDVSSVEPLKAALDPSATDASAQLANKELVAALGRIGDRSAVPALIPFLRSKDNYTRIEAVQVLGAMKSPEAVEPLIQLATDEATEPFLNRKAIEALGQIGDARAVPVLLRMLTKERHGVSFYVESSFALFQLGAPAADALLPALEGKDAELVSWAQGQGINPASYAMKAAQVLGDLRDHRAVEPLVRQLGYTHADPRIQAMVRMQAADALGRMRATEAVKPLAALVLEPDPTVRRTYVRALTLLGGRDALPALEKAASTGDWYAREVAVKGLAMLGDARERPLLDKLAAGEAARTATECKQAEETGCDNPAALGKKRSDALVGYAQLLEAGQACTQDAGCWTQRLEKANGALLERTALELGRSGAPASVTPLASRLGERDTEARSAVIQAVDWLVETPATAKQARSTLPALRKQLDDERGNTHLVGVNEDLRRLVVKLERT